MCSVQCVSIDWLILARVGLNSYVRTSEVNRLKGSLQICLTCYLLLWRGSTVVTTVLCGGPLVTAGRCCRQLAAPVAAPPRHLCSGSFTAALQ